MKENFEYEEDREIVSVLQRAGIKVCGTIKDFYDDSDEPQDEGIWFCLDDGLFVSDFNLATIIIEGILRHNNGWLYDEYDRATGFLVKG